MALTIEGVPESIPLSAVQDFARSLGLDPNIVRRIEVGLDSVGVTAVASIEVIARDRSGNAFLAAKSDAVSVHQLAIRIDPHA